MNVTAIALARRFLGVRETPGPASTPIVVAMLMLDNPDATSDDIPWCSAFVNAIAWLLDLPRSRSHRARSWLRAGAPIALRDAVVGFDVVVLKQHDDDPGPEVEKFRGHVGFFAGRTLSGEILVIGGNQSNAVTVERYAARRLLGVRRLAVS